MKIGEARRIYAAQLNELREQRRMIEQEKKKPYTDDSGYTGVIFERSDEIEKHLDETQNFMEKLTAYSTMARESAAAKQQGEAASEYVEESVKCMEIARRIAKGGKVPSYDEERLMRYNMEMYMAAKNMSIVSQNESRKEYDSLWEDEDDSYQERDTSSEAVDDMEVRMDLPEIVDFDIADSEVTE